MSNQPPKPRRCGVYATGSDRGLQNKCSQWFNPEYHYGMCWSRASILELSVYTGNVCCMSGAVIIGLTHCSIYQEYLAKTLADKYGNLNVQVDKIVNDANAELQMLHQKLAGEWNI